MIIKIFDGFLDCFIFIYELKYIGFKQIKDYKFLGENKWDI